MLWPYLKNWEWEWIFGRAVKTISYLGVRSLWLGIFHQWTKTSRNEFFSKWWVDMEILRPVLRHSEIESGPGVLGLFSNSKLIIFWNTKTEFLVYGNKVSQVAVPTRHTRIQNSNLVAVSLQAAWSKKKCH